MIKEILHNKRAATEEHIRQLERNGKAGVRYTAMIPDMVFLVFGLLCDVGWVTHYIAGYLYFRDHGFQSALDFLMLTALAGSAVGVSYISRLGMGKRERDRHTGAEELELRPDGLCGSCGWHFWCNAGCFLHGSSGFAHLYDGRRFSRICGRSADLLLLPKRNHLRGAMMIILQLILFCILFTAMVAIATSGKAINVLFFYPRAFQEQAFEIGLADREVVTQKQRRFMPLFFLAMLAALLLIIGLWNGVRDFKSAYLQALLFLEVMNWYDGVVIDRLWVGHSRFWSVPGMEGVPYVQTWPQVLKKRGILTAIWLVGAAIVAALVVLIFGRI